MTTTLNVGELLNLVGLSTGVVLYAMLLAMVVRADRTLPGHAFDPLLLVTSVLGLAWNLCALPVYELPKMGIAGPFPTLSAIGFAALGLLPAVVVHSVLRDERQRVTGAAPRGLATVAYVVSVAAAVLHVVAAVNGDPVPSAVGMRLLTYAFVGLAMPLAAITRRRPGAGRALWAAALAIFAVSALHLSQLHREASWPVELLGHHASLPLAFAILYQDYRFALADLFLKRALGLLAIVAVTFAAVATIGVRSLPFARFVESDPRQLTLLVTLWVATALLYPRLRAVTSRFVDSVVLRRPDYNEVRAAVTRGAQQRDTVEGVLDLACARIGEAFGAAFVTWREWRPAVSDGTLGALVQRGGGSSSPWEDGSTEEPSPGSVAVWVTVPTADSPRFAFALGSLGGGRRLLSDDQATLESIGVIVARRIDALRITDERYERKRREQEIATLATEAELRALRAQLNPHFLFNALTTIGYLIQSAPPRALETLLRLTTLLRGVLRTEGEFTTLGRELELVESYLEIERARFEDRLRVVVDVPAGLRTISLPPLLLQPLVENAVKHGIAHKQSGGEVSIHARLEGERDPQQLVLTVRDTGAGASAQAIGNGRARGLGLRNVERRLAYQYGSSASIQFTSAVNGGTSVVIRLPRTAPVRPPLPMESAAS